MKLDLQFCGSCFPDPNRHFPEQLSLPPCLHYFVFPAVPFVMINLVILDILLRKYDSTRAIKFNSVLIVQLISTLTTVLVSLVLTISAAADFLADESIYASSERFLGYGLLTMAMVEVVMFFYYQYKKGYSSTGRLWCFWLLSILSLIPSFVVTLNVILNDHVENKEYVQMGSINHALFLVLFTFCLINFFLYSAPTVDYEFAKKFHPEEYASFVSQLTMWWANGMMYTGFKKALVLDDIWAVRDEDRSEECTRVLARQWNRELRDNGYKELMLHIDDNHQNPSDEKIHENGKEDETDNLPDVEIKTGTKENEGGKDSERKGKPSLFWAMMRAYKGHLTVTMAYKLINDCLTFTAPKIMELFLGYMALDGSAVYGVSLALLLLINNVMQTAFLQRYFYVGTIVGIRQRTALIDMVYRKSLVLSSQGRQESTIGQIVNLMSVDAQKFMDLMTYINLLWSAPFQILLAMILLYQQLGLSAFAGLCYMVLTMPINVVSGNTQKKFQMKQMKAKDGRVKLLTDILNGIKVLKLYAWENAFMSKVNKIRECEIKFIKKTMYLQAVTGFFWICGPYMVALFAFTAYILAGNTLYPTTAFVSIALFNILRFPMSVLPMIISQLVQAKVAMDRLTNFFLLDELQTDAISRAHTKGNAIELKNCSFIWDVNDKKKDGKPKNGSPLSVKFKKSNKEQENGVKSEEMEEKNCDEEDQLLTTDKNPKVSPTSRFTLDKIDFNVEKGSFYAILGNVGSGKSSMLNAILGEMRKQCGCANVDGSVAYVGQQMWIRNATVKDNILFGKEFDSELYDRTLGACALVDDLKILDSGDMTEIGEKGINLSGGQKARVSLARAVYSDRDIYLLDDPLAAVDAHVAAHIYEKVIGPQGMLATKTRLLVTNKLHLLSETDQIINLQDGQIKEKGTYCELLEKDTEDELSFKQLCKVHLNQQQMEEGCENVKDGREGKAEDSVSLKSVEQGTKKGDSLDDENEGDVGKVEGLLERASRIFGASQKSLVDLTSAEVAEEMKEIEIDNMHQHVERKTETEGDDDVIAADDIEAGEEDKEVDSKEKKKDSAGKKLMTTETVESGHVSINVYMQYWRSLGYLVSFMGVAGLIVIQLFTYVSMMWVAWWSDNTQAIMARVIGQEGEEGNYTLEMRNDQLADENFWGLMVYGFIGMLFGVIVVANAITFAEGNKRSSITLHRDMLHGVLRSPLSFFETTPLGRITNRLSKDIDVVDNVLTGIIKTFMQCILVVMTTIFAISMAIPAFLAVLVPLVIVYVAVLKFYVATSRQIKRIESTWKSPLYSNFGETLQGLTDIRAYQMSDYFIGKNEELVDKLVRTTFGNMVINRWLAVRLECIGTGIVFSTALILVFFREGVSAGNAGVAFTYAISCSQVLNWLCRMWSEVESNIVAVERIREYCKLKPEAKWESEAGVMPEGWPKEGKIEVNNLEVKYREDLAPALKDITCTFNPSERVGIVGRTGSGKSTMTISLFRIVENSKGSITIDGLDIKKLGLHDLRSTITIIPQDPVIFVGTIRDNLDPFGLYSDEQLWEALELSHLKSFVADLQDQLQFQLGEGGTNISVGQRQLICLARAILRKSKILVLDEATASVDLSTDELIQNTIRQEFKHSTVVTIAHRINTIMDSNRILVLEKGSVKEFGTLSELAESKGYFHSILEKENLLPAETTTTTSSTA